MTPAKALSLDRTALEAHQLARLNGLLGQVRETNEFYRGRLPRADPASLKAFSKEFSFTAKQDFVEDEALHPPYGSNFSFPIESYNRFHRTSGTTSAPLHWLDTAESWEWMMGCWERIFEAAEVTPADRMFFPYSFGPFIGFWLAFEQSARMGCLTIPGGGSHSAGRLETILDNGVTVLCATPTYALRLGLTAQELGLDMGRSKVRRIIVAGEPGGSIPATRALIESCWPGARVFDHHGLTEVGPVSYECPVRRGVLHVIEAAYLPEVVDQETLEPIGPGEPGELILTNLGRVGSPAIRYRTRDIVRRSERQVCECGSCELALEGGILGRDDDMVVVRGVNLYPSAVEEVIRADGGVGEFRVEIREERGLPEVRLLIEPDNGLPEAELEGRVQASLHKAFGLRCAVECASNGSLPRFEAKSKRWVKV